MGFLFFCAEIKYHLLRILSYFHRIVQAIACPEVSPFIGKPLGRTTIPPQ
jgi:hypothetical protein